MPDEINVHMRIQLARFDDFAALEVAARTRSGVEMVDQPRRQVRARRRKGRAATNEATTTTVTPTAAPTHGGRGPEHRP